MRELDDVLANPRFCRLLDSPKLWAKMLNNRFVTGTVTVPGGKVLNVVAGWNEDGKEHVSVSLADTRRFKRGELPTWYDMCVVKDVFWDDEEEVFQIHPPKSCYLDLGAILHLWRAKDGGEVHAEGMPE